MTAVSVDTRKPVMRGAARNEPRGETALNEEGVGGGLNGGGGGWG